VDNPSIGDDDPSQQVSCLLDTYMLYERDREVERESKIVHNFISCSSYVYLYIYRLAGDG